MASKFLRTDATLEHLGRLKNQPPVCDFCGEHAPRFIYAAERTTTGIERRCWRWCACERCAEWVEAENWPEVILLITELLRRNSLGRLSPSLIRQAVSRALSDFNRFAIRNPENRYGTVP